MGRFLDLALLVFSLQATSVWGQAAEKLEDPTTSPALNVKAEAIFPDSEIFGIKIVNGKPVDIQLSFSNEETTPVTLEFVGGSFWTPEYGKLGPQVVSNLTSKKYGIEIPAGESESVPYRFTTNLQPADFRLNFAAIIGKDNSFYTLQVFNGTVSVIEPDTSIFDPQILFLYLFLLACAVGVGYTFYNIWVVPYFPQKKRGKGAKSAPIKKIDVGSDKPDTDGPAVATGAASYAEDWIPAHHLQRPEARRLKSGGKPKPKQG